MHKYTKRFPFFSFLKLYGFTIIKTYEKMEKKSPVPKFTLISFETLGNVLKLNLQLDLEHEQSIFIQS